MPPPTHSEREMDVPCRSAGWKFAEQQMQRHGWTEGKGLGKREDGRSEAIKVKVKCDTAGVGHNSAEQFTFHWWDHVFNKTASSISVEPDQGGVTVKKLSEDGSAVSSKKPRKAMLNTNMLYGRFIKSATLTSGGEKPVESSSSDSSDSSEDEDSKLDLSSATKLSDEDLMKICGGRTAHKGARHGLTMSAKLSRIEEQERAFMEKYGKRETNLQPAKSTPEVQLTEEFNCENKKTNKKKKHKEEMGDGEGKDNPTDCEVPQKKKKKQKKGDSEESVEDTPNDHDQDHVPSSGTSKKKRNKVPGNLETTTELEVLGDHKDDLPAKKRKKKQKKGDSEESVEDTPNGHDKIHVPTTEEDTKSSKKKRRKFPGNLEKTVEVVELLSDHKNDTSLVEENARPAKKKKKRRKAIECEESIMFNSDGDSRAETEDKEYENAEEEARKSKRRKKKTTKDPKELVEAEEHASEEEQSRRPKNNKWKVDDPSTKEDDGRARRKKKRVHDEDEPKEEEDTKATKKKDKDRRD